MRLTPEQPLFEADVLIVTVTKVESRAVMQVFEQAVGDRPTPEVVGDRVYFNLGIVNDARIFLTQSEMGTGGLGASLQTVGRGIEALSPTAVIMVGIAFGINEQKQSIGDVLVTEQLRLYELQRMGTQDGKPNIILRGDKPHASPWLINLFKSADLMWEGAQVRFGTVLTGEKLVDNLDFREQLHRFESEAIGGEMEGAGLYVACHDKKVDWILVKGVCDWADGNKGEDKAVRQKTAAQNAAGFVLETLQLAQIDWEQRRPNMRPSPNSPGDQLRKGIDQVLPPIAPVVSPVRSPFEMGRPGVQLSHKPMSAASNIGGVQIFLAHAKEDEAQVMELYERLRSRGYRPWLDKKDLLGGQNWRDAIPKAIKASELFIACLSSHSTVKKGYILNEFLLALRELANRPRDQIYLIPLRLDACEPPDLGLEEYGVNLRNYHYIDYFAEDGFSRLEEAIAYQYGELLSSQAESTNQPESKRPSPPPEQTFEYEVVRVDPRGSIVERQRFQAVYESVDLGNGVTLELVKIPGGSFLMGSPSDELGRISWEGPQHRVSVPSFWMGRYPITQEQWRAIASLPKVNRPLQSDPSNFKGGNRPVERVSWEEAVEGCDRLSVHTGRTYRLPSEGEWEYACRAGTKTPFHYGETITTELANYRGTDHEEFDFSGSYGDGPKGEYREKTTPVDMFEGTNQYGLFDMHGNVWEWCQDHWHDNYDDAPTDGSAWIEGGDSDRRIIRGGSWNYYSPWLCRSASRHYFTPGYRNRDLGFRVVLAPR